MSLRFTEGSVSDPLVGTDLVGGDNVERVKVVFGDAAAAERVERQVPLPARDWHGGTQTFDTGNVAIDSPGPTLVTTAADQWVDVIMLINPTQAAQPFTLTDGAGLSYGGADLAPRELRVVPMHGIKFAGGVKLGAEDSVLRAQVKGTR